MTRPICSRINPQIHARLQEGVVIPAHPLVLTSNRKLDERRQRGLSRYYLSAGAGGLAVGVHTTQFQIRKPNVGLFKPVLELAAEEMDRSDAIRQPAIRIGGICGDTCQATKEAELLTDLGYHFGLLSLTSFCDANVDELVEHCRCVGKIIPLVGFYLQKMMGGPYLSYEFWRRFCELECVVAIKLAPFNRYQTLEVLRAVVDSGRDDIALYTGNDDNIVIDLLSCYQFKRAGEIIRRRIVGGLLGHWSVWTRKAVELLAQCHSLVEQAGLVSKEMFCLANEVTDSNSALFDTANSYKGVIAGVHEVLRRQGLLEGIWCLDPTETLGPGQMEQIDRVYNAYPHLNDDSYVAEIRDYCLSG